MKKENTNILTQYADASARVKYLRESIKNLEAKLEKFRTTDYGMASDTVTCGRKRRKPLGTVKVTGFRIDDYRRTEWNLRERKILLEEREEELLELLNKAEEFIESIDDIEIRNILSLYYIEDLTWVQVAIQMNELYKNRKYTSDSCRMKHDRFLEKNF